MLIIPQSLCLRSHILMCLSSTCDHINMFVMKHGIRKNYNYPLRFQSDFSAKLVLVLPSKSFHFSELWGLQNCQEDYGPVWGGAAFVSPERGKRSKKKKLLCIYLSAERRVSIRLEVSTARMRSDQTLVNSFFLVKKKCNKVLPHLALHYNSGNIRIKYLTLPRISHLAKMLGVSVTHGLCTSWIYKKHSWVWL